MYVDLHCHILYNTDDGATDKNEMLKLIDASYKDGVREMCLTPHFNHAFYGDNKANSDLAFDTLTKEAARIHPEMRFYRGNEIFYHNSCIDFIKKGKCHTLNDTKYVLVDFSYNENKFTIISALKKFISNGYIPVLAHAERYHELKPFSSDFDYIKDIGALIQVNAASVIGKNGFRQKITSLHLIKHGLCDVVASDTHNSTNRTTCINEAANLIKKRFGSDVAASLTYKNPRRILLGERIIKPNSDRSY